MFLVLFTAVKDDHIPLNLISFLNLQQNQLVHQTLEIQDLGLQANAIILHAVLFKYLCKLADAANYPTPTHPKKEAKSQEVKTEHFITRQVQNKKQMLV